MTEMLIVSGEAVTIAMEIVTKMATNKEIYVVKKLTQIFRKLCRKW